MIYAKDFIASQMCRSSEFTTCEGENLNMSAVSDQSRICTQYFVYIPGVP
ncbi:unnamed protein product [Anisakis simplex]|uniref:Uncharacterized protein n=1 Tax=Anisakis simplex TaxID=6269 RepID=A0A0M3KKI9_ANISI|nr:unnamed protein product [Anisakis simplex]